MNTPERLPARRGALGTIAALLACVGFASVLQGADSEGKAESKGAADARPTTTGPSEAPTSLTDEEFSARRLAQITRSDPARPVTWTLEELAARYRRALLLAGDPTMASDPGLSRRVAVAEALQELLWVFDSGMAAFPDLYPIRVTSVLDAIVRLGGRYPPAITALRTLRDETEKRFLGGTGGFGTGAGLLRALNHALNEDQRTRAVFAQLADGDPRKARLGPGYESRAKSPATMAREIEQTTWTRSGLRKRRDAFEKQWMENPNDLTAAGVVRALNRALDEDASRVVAVLDRLPPGDPRRPVIARGMYRELIELKRYRDAALAFTFPQMLAPLARAAFDDLVSANYPRGPSLEARLRSAITGAALNIEVLAGSGSVDQARTLAEKLLAYNSSAETKALLQKHLERAGQPALLSSPRTGP